MSDTASAPPVSASRRVLFVDDDPLFLETVGELMSVLSERQWVVLTAESASRAFAILQAEPVDMVVVDVQMGVMDGIQMLSLLNRGYPNIQKVVLTGHATEKYRAACLSNGAELFLEKPANPSGWQSLYGVLQELIKLRPEDGFRGLLRRVGLPDVIQMECLARSSSILEVSNARIRGRVFIETGQIVHAELGETSGEEAFNHLVGLGGGQFNLRPFTEPPQRTISGQWEFLLMEAARKSDEAKEQQGETPAPAGAETTAPPQPSAEIAAELERILAGAAGKTGPDGSAPTEVTATISAGYEAIPAVPPGVPWRPRVEEMLILSAQGTVVYQWQCASVDLWVSFFEFASQRGQRLAQNLPFGRFDRLEIQSGGARAVVVITPDRGVLVRTRHEALSPPNGKAA
jgi:CheY-like chemotaxis protein